MAKQRIEKIAIGQEKHQDGNLHLHCAIVLHRKVDIKDAHRLDLTIDGQKYHGKYEAMKGSLAQAVNYCTKHDPDPLLDGIDLKALMHAHTSKKKEVCPDIIAGKTTVAKFVQENPEHLFQYQSMDRSVKSFKLATAEAVTTIGSRGIWIWGPPNTGKTHYARRISLKQYGQNPYEKSTNKWWDGYENEKVVVMNDVDPSHAL